MSDEKFQNKYRIKSARAVWHDYNGGNYFITICTKNREHYFGEIVSHVETGRAPSLQMTEIGKFTLENLHKINIHYPYAEIPLFVVMPNHIHALVFIDENKIPYIRRDVAIQNVETGRAPSLRGKTAKNKKMQQIGSFKGWLSVAIGGFKSATTKFAYTNNIDFAWQTRYHDVIIRNQNEMNHIADYIENNPSTWESDCFNENNKL